MTGSVFRVRVRENWYRDLWLTAITGLVAWALLVQSSDRTAAINANVEARYSDCRRGNDVRGALRKQVEQGRLERPFLLKVLPALNTPAVIALLDKNEREELKGFASSNCIEIAEEALPGHHKRYRLSVTQ